MRRSNKQRLQLADKRRVANAYPWRRSTPENRRPPTPPDQVLAQADAKQAGQAQS